jgi:hypothetical protein
MAVTAVPGLEMRLTNADGDPLEREARTILVTGSVVGIQIRG